MLFAFVSSYGQNPGLLISEFLQNPAGTDSPFEYVELLATDNIDFSVTPYTIIVSNNGTATANGWVEGGAISYAFEINTGTVAVGDVVYVGGSSMAPTGTKLRTIDTGVDPGDGGIGNANSGGVFGNGGGNCDGIAVFNMGVASITSSSIPTDAVFYGTGVGGAEVNAGVDGYQLPLNDLYSGGKLTATSFVAVDEDLTVATGMFDLSTNTFSVIRTFGSGNATDTSAIVFGTPTATLFDVSFVESDITVLESDGIISVDIEVNTTSTVDGTAEVTLVLFSNATNVQDFVLLDTLITFPSGSTNNQTFTIQIEDDAIIEQSEYIVLTLDNLNNVELSGNTSVVVYISDNDRVLPTASNELKLQLLTSYSNGAEGTNSAEIIAFDTTSNQLFIANSIANQIDIVDFTDPSVPVAVMSINLDSIGSINSIAVYNGIVALAVENNNPQLNGYVVFFDAAGNWVNRVEVGAMPDMITFNHAKTKVLTANEGEPDTDYLVDPEGSISIIDITPGFANITQLNVSNVNFNSFDAQETQLKASGVRIFGPGASVSQDIEPEYITILPDDNKAFIALQENNALAVLDINTATITEILPLGTIDHNMFGFGLDASDRTNDINIANFPVKGMFMPDAISNISIGGNNYILTANEGDSRDYDAYSEEERVKDLTLDETVFPDAEFIQENSLIGRMKTTSANGDIDMDGDFDEIYTYGTRSFSIWDENGNLVFDSGDWIEQIISNDPVFASMFNASNSAGVAESKNRSDDKGPEPEGVNAVMIDGNAFAFVSLERVGGVMIFNINNPNEPVYAGYYNNRDVASNGPDRGAEGLLYINADDSPNGNGLLILANEVSSTLSIYQSNSCIELSDLVTYAKDSVNTFCDNAATYLVAQSNTTLNYQWIESGVELSNETNDTLDVVSSGNFQVHFTNATEQCSGISDTLMIEEIPAPTVTASANMSAICEGDSTTITASGDANSYAWNNGLTDGQFVAPTQDTYYVVSGEALNGCVTLDSTMITVNPLPMPVITVNAGVLTTQTYDSYSWSLNGTPIPSSNTNTWLPTEDGNYEVTVQDNNGCENTSAVYAVAFTNIAENFNNVSLFPNPVNDKLRVELNNEMISDLKILDIQGKVIYLNTIFDNFIEINVSNFSEGIYIIQLYNETSTITKRFVVKH